MKIQSMKYASSDNEGSEFWDLVVEHDGKEYLRNVRISHLHKKFGADMDSARSYAIHKKLREIGRDIEFEQECDTRA